MLVTMFCAYNSLTHTQHNLVFPLFPDQIPILSHNFSTNLKTISRHNVHTTLSIPIIQFLLYIYLIRASHKNWVSSVLSENTSTLVNYSTNPFKTFSISQATLTHKNNDNQVTHNFTAYVIKQRFARIFLCQFTTYPKNYFSRQFFTQYAKVEESTWMYWFVCVLHMTEISHSFIYPSSTPN